MNPRLTGLLATKGRANDSILAHISPREARILKAYGGSGTRNPRTGLLEFAEDPYEPYIKSGMERAQEILKTSSPSPFPAYTPTQANAPSRVSYFDYTPSAPMSQIQAPNYQMTAGNTQPWQQWNPQQGAQYGQVNTQVNAQPWNYQGLSPEALKAQAAGYQFNSYGPNAPQFQQLQGGDYNALQAALTAPGAAAAQGAYQQGTQNLINAMGGRGLYGSSIMQNQQREGLDKVYQQTLADNAAKAAAARYGMQQQDLTNASGQQMAGWQARMNENLAGNSANLDYAKLLTGLNQQNVANQLAQSNQANALGFNYAQLGTQAASDSAARALQQQSALNALRSGDLQQLQGLLAAQNTAQNIYNQAARSQDLAREQNINQYQTTETAGQRGQAYDTARLAQAEAAQRNLYNQGKMQADQTWNNLMTDWQNKQNYEKNFLYPQQAQSFNQAQQEMIMNRALALAGAGAPLSAGSNLYTAYQNQVNAANNNQWLQLAGQLGGGLLSNWGSIFK